MLIGYPDKSQERPITTPVRKFRTKFADIIKHIDSVDCSKKIFQAQKNKLQSLCGTEQHRWGLSQLSSSKSRLNNCSDRRDRQIDASRASKDEVDKVEELQWQQVSQRRQRLMQDIMAGGEERKKWILEMPEDKQFSVYDTNARGKSISTKVLQNGQDGRRAAVGAGFPSVQSLFTAQSPGGVGAGDMTVGYDVTMQNGPADTTDENNGHDRRSKKLYDKEYEEQQTIITALQQRFQRLRHEAYKHYTDQASVQMIGDLHHLPHGINSKRAARLLVYNCGPESSDANINIRAQFTRPDTTDLLHRYTGNKGNKAFPPPPRTLLGDCIGGVGRSIVDVFPQIKHDRDALSDAAHSVTTSGGDAPVNNASQYHDSVFNHSMQATGNSNAHHPMNVQTQGPHHTSFACTIQQPQLASRRDPMSKLGARRSTVLQNSSTASVVSRNRRARRTTNRQRDWGRESGALGMSYASSGGLSTYGAGSSKAFASSLKSIFAVKSGPIVVGEDSEKSVNDSVAIEASASTVVPGAVTGSLVGASFAKRRVQRGSRWSQEAPREVSLEQGGDVRVSDGDSGEDVGPVESNTFRNKEVQKRIQAIRDGVLEKLSNERELKVAGAASPLSLPNIKDHGHAECMGN